MHVRPSVALVNNDCKGARGAAQRECTQAAIKHSETMEAGTTRTSEQYTKMKEANNKEHEHEHEHEQEEEEEQEEQEEEEEQQQQLQTTRTAPEASGAGFC